MNNAPHSTVRYAAILILVASGLLLSGCGDDPSGPEVFNGTSYDFLKQDQWKQTNTGSAENAYDSIVMYVDKFADLKALLQGSTEYTFFAPSNKAFVSLTALPGLKDPDQINPEIIKGVLMYHFVAGKKMSSDLTAGVSINTIYTDPTSPAAPQAIKVNTDGTLLTGSTTTNIMITAHDQLTSNGVVHTTSTVLIPPLTGSKLASILGSLGATVLLGKDFTYMAFLISHADTGIANPAETFAGAISTGTNITLLAIPNAAFVGTYNQIMGQPGSNVPTDAQMKTFITGSWTSGANGGTAGYTLRNHVLKGKYVVAATSGASTFTNATFVNSLFKNNLIVSTSVPASQCQCTSGVVISSQSGNSTYLAPIMKADISTQAGISNGILHVVGGILWF